MLLYHFNFGWPLIDEGTELIAAGEWKLRGKSGDDFLFNANNDFKKCNAPISEHKKNGEAVVFIYIAKGSSGLCECFIHNHQTPIKSQNSIQKETTALAHQLAALGQKCVCKGTGTWYKSSNRTISCP